MVGLVIASETTWGAARGSRPVSSDAVRMWYGSVRMPYLEDPRRATERIHGVSLAITGAFHSRSQGRLTRDYKADRLRFPEIAISWFPA